MTENVNVNVSVKNCKVIELPKFGDENRGHLTFFESNNQVNFDIKRVYYIYDVGDLTQVRGPHAHKKTMQLFVCINGSAVFHLDDGKTKQDVLLDKPNKAILLGNEVWHSMDKITKGTVILVATSEKYNKEDYLLDYNQFIEYTKKTETKK